MNKDLLEALASQYRGEIAVAVANIQVYLAHPVGIGEHSDITGAIDEQIEKLASADEKLSTIEKYFGLLQ